jgi:CheY-like chemotaxis protein
MNGVLVVDDDADIRETLSVVLERQGFRVVTAVDGADALQYLQGGELPSLILLDLMMPRMTGEEFRVAQIANNQLKAIPVVALSGASRLDETAVRLGVEVLPKPIELSQLLKTVSRFCQKES